MPLLSRLAVQAARAYGMLVGKQGITATYLVVAGGAGGGFDRGGGGGAGGYRTGTTPLSALTTYSITVGAGGNGSTAGANKGSNGSNSVFSTITSAGGGGGGSGSSATGADGGSGGGGRDSGGVAGGSGNTPSTSPSQGNNGGVGGSGSSSTGSGGGGGGASAVGNAGKTTGTGVGGAGSASSISGSSVTYAGGGGGGAGAAGGAAGGSGGGGAGSGSNTAGIAGTTNTGGGGGGGGDSSGAGGAGGSGIVIISYPSATPLFVGGTLTTSGGNQIHTFTSSGTLSPITPITASYLVVAGGGAGSTSVGFTEASGGGGAGGLLSGSTTIYSGATYVVTVGAGGAGPSAYGGTNNGSNSVLSGTGLTTLTSIGGGSGTADGPANSGGSGGGAGAGVTSRTGGAGTSGQGNIGGNGFGSATTSVRSGGGGGGSGAAGANATSGQGGTGGAGTASSITGTSVTYAAGGGGSSQTAGASGGSSVGGNGQGLSPATSTTSGIVNTGSGGGGAINTNGGSGGSGIVIISYAGSQVFNGGLVTSSGGNTIHTFTSTGALTPLTNNLTNSLRFRASASAFLSRTPTIAGSQTTWTWSGWVKRGTLGSQQKLFTAGSSGSLFASFEFIAGNSFQFFAFNGSTNAYLVTTQVFRDPSAWYHITFVCDTTQATAANRIRIYINGTQVTAFSTSTYPSQNFAFPINNSVIHNIGRDNINVADYFDGYMDDIYFIDGQALEPYFFGNNDANGVWKPILYKGTYGTNGFYLNFSNTTSTTTLGFDSSPNGNNWTTNNISLTAGTTYDAMTDVPTNTSATTANYCVLNPLFRGVNTSGTMQAGNLELNAPNNSFWYNGVGTTFVSSGKWYAEFIPVSGTVSSVMIGIVNDAYRANDFPGGTGANGYSYVSNTGNKFFNNTGAGVSYGASYTTNDVIGVALDLDAGTLTFYKNNVSQGTAFTGIAVGNWTFAVASAASSVIAFNAGQRPFSYTPPTGFVRLNTYNLPTPTILQGNKYMDATLWSGNNATTNIVNQGQFRPDFVWIKNRNTTNWHMLSDSVRGVGKNLFSNVTDAEGTNPGFGYLNGFNSNGFLLTPGSSNSDNVNATGNTYVGWQWQAGQGTNTTNTAGSITSTVSVNATAGFSIVTYTGSGAAGTVGHGLGVAPAMIITKNRTTAGNSWVTWHKGLTNAYSSTTGFIYLDQTAASGTTTNFYDGTAMTSSTFRWQTGNININSTSNNYVSYVWAEIAGFSAFGSYTGNGSADGPFIYTGFRPKFVLVKASSSAESWYINDSARDTFNPDLRILAPNTADAEFNNGTAWMDLTSNGFKIRYNTAPFNTNAATYIYMAFAENPAKISNAR